MTSRFHPALMQLDSELRAALLPVIDNSDFSASFSASQVDYMLTATGLSEQQFIFALLPVAAACSWTPISNFQVGAIAKGKSGSLYFGANMEFLQAPLQQTVHAEQSAITHAMHKGETGLLSVSVNYSPCGHCRQFMNELNSGGDLMIHLPDQPARPLSYYLPADFGPSDLGISSLLMDPQQHQLSDHHDDPLVKQALDAANRSHAPYTAAYSGVALQTHDEHIVCGRYTENAAFNPSLPPLQAALVMLNMYDKPVSSLSRAVLVESASAPFSQLDATRSTLAALGCNDLLHVFV